MKAKKPTTSKAKKGADFQRWVKKWLEDNGWVVHNQITASKQIFIKGKPIWISKRQDIFGEVDLIAKKEHEPTLWIQATCHSGIGEKEKGLRTIPWGVGDKPQIWMKRETGVIDIYTVNSKELTHEGKIIRRKYLASTEF